MRVLYLPHTSSPGSLATDHAYGWATGFFPKWAARNPNLRVYWPVPRNALTEQRNAFYKVEPFKDQFKFIEVDMSPSQIIEQCILPPELPKLFDIDGGDYFFDAIFCEKPVVMGSLMGQVGMSQTNFDSKVVVCNFHYALDADKHHYVSRYSEADYFINAAFGDAFLFGCGPECNIDSRRQFVEKLRVLASASTVNKVLAKPMWVKPCSDVEEVNKVYEEAMATGVKKGDGFRVHYGFSINLNFNYDAIITMMKKLTMMDKSLKFVITTPSMAGPSAKFDWMEVNVKCPRREFWQHALKSHVFIMWFNGDKGLNHGSVFEMSLLGVVPIFYKNSIPYPWDDSYPFVFRNETELLALLRWIKENYSTAKVQDVVQSNRKLILDISKTESSNQVVIEWMEKTFAEKLSRVELAPLFKDILPRIDKPMTLQQVYEFIKSNSDTKVDFSKPVGARKYYIGTRDSIRTSMLRLGWKDVGTLDEVRFER